ncbi:MAG: hypothetical protein MPJ24_09055 [Pirellulaceae bacterium]|nr:hypothetical protein [Pirellulaceae bacterium]
MSSNHMTEKHHIYSLLLIAELMDKSARADLHAMMLPDGWREFINHQLL